MVFTKPFDKAYETCIDLEDICREYAILFFEFKRRFLVWIREYATGMMISLAACVVQDQERFLRRWFCFIGAECGVGAFRIFLFGCCIAEIKYRRNGFSFILIIL